MRRAKKARNLAAFLVLLESCFLFSPAALAEKIAEWRIEQKQYLSGDHVIYVTPGAIKIINKTIGYEVISKAPDWHVYAFRPDDKVICVVSRPAFYKDQEFQPVAVGLANRKLTRVGTQSIGGKRVDVFQSGLDEVWIGHFSGVKRPIEDLIVAYYRLDSIDGFLMKASTNGENIQEKGASFLSTEYKGRVNIVETLRITAVPFNSHDFDLPAEFKKASSFEQIMTSSQRRKHAESIMMELDVGERLGKKKVESGN